MLSSFKSKIGNVFLPIHLWAFLNGVTCTWFHEFQITHSDPNSNFLTYCDQKHPPNNKQASCMHARLRLIGWKIPNSQNHWWARIKLRKLFSPIFVMIFFQLLKAEKSEKENPDWPKFFLTNKKFVSLFNSSNRET